MKDRKVLVIGNGLIGSAICEYLSLLGANVQCAGRDWNRFPTSPYPTLSLDLNDLSEFFLTVSKSPPSFSVVSIGVSSIRRCKDNPNSSRTINVDQTLKIIEFLESIDSQTLVFSSSLIWDTWEGPDEDKISRPRTEYGYQKLLMEHGIVQRKLKTTIIRLGKVIAAESPFIQKLRRVIEKQESEFFYNNLFLAPVHITSIYKALDRWISQELGKEVNLVPSRQWSEIDLVRELLIDLGLQETRLIERELNLPIDELPRSVACPDFLKVSPLGNYGVSSLKIELEKKL